jgi:hypothetical protein
MLMYNFNLLLLNIVCFSYLKKKTGRGYIQPGLQLGKNFIDF